MGTPHSRVGHNTLVDNLPEPGAERTRVGVYCRGRQTNRAAGGPPGGPAMRTDTAPYARPGS
jgi:hypothetical protein